MTKDGAQVMTVMIMFEEADDTYFLGMIPKCDAKVLAVLQ